MASLRPKGSSYFVRFRLAGRQFERDVGQDRARAEATRKRVEATLLDIKNGRLRVPEGVDIAQFIVSDGAATAKPKLPDTQTLTDLFHRYEEALPAGALEPTSLTTHRVHRNHLTRILGAKQPAQEIGTAELQAYINKRSKEEGPMPEQERVFYLEGWVDQLLEARQGPRPHRKVRVTKPPKEGAEPSEQA